MSIFNLGKLRIGTKLGLSAGVGVVLVVGMIASGQIQNVGRDAGGRRDQVELRAARRDRGVRAHDPPPADRQPRHAPRDGRQAGRGRGRAHQHTDGGGAEAVHAGRRARHARDQGAVRPRTRVLRPLYRQPHRDRHVAGAGDAAARGAGQAARRMDQGERRRREARRQDPGGREGADPGRCGVQGCALRDVGLFRARRRPAAAALAQIDRRCGEHAPRRRRARVGARPLRADRHAADHGAALQGSDGEGPAAQRAAEPDDEPAHHAEPRGDGQGPCPAQRVGRAARHQCRDDARRRAMRAPT